MLMQQINFPAFVNRRGTKTQFFQRFNHVKRMAARAKKSKTQWSLRSIHHFWNEDGCKHILRIIKHISHNTKKAPSCAGVSFIESFGKISRGASDKKIRSTDFLLCTFLMNLIVVYSDCHRSECSFFWCSSDWLVFVEIDDNTQSCWWGDSTRLDFRSLMRSSDSFWMFFNWHRLMTNESAKAQLECESINSTDLLRTIYEHF